MLKLEVGVDFDFEVFGEVGSRSADDFEDLVVEPIECGFVVAQACLAKGDHDEPAVFVGLESHLDRRDDLGLNNETGTRRRSRWHVDGEIALWLDDFQREHKEDQ